MRRRAGDILAAMAARRPTAPDLFSVVPSEKAPEKAMIRHEPVVSGRQSEEPKPLLPKDLAGSLRRLDDTELDALLAAVTSEAGRRGRLPQKPRPSASRGSSKPVSDESEGFLTTGKLNAVRAAFKAGVKPSVIARQFGISQSDIKKALSTPATSQKS
jgi:hypothetical protein